MNSKVELIANGRSHKGWSKIQIQRSLYTISGFFELSLSPVWEGSTGATLEPGSKFEIKMDSHILITGYIDSVKIQVDSSNRTLTVCGRDTTGDLVDCNSLRVARTWENASLETIASDLIGPFGIRLAVKIPTGALFPTWGIQEETIFENLSRAASLRGLTLVSDGLGALVITRTGADRRSQGRIGLNSGILGIEFAADYRNRFSLYRIQSQNYGATQGDEANLKIKASTTDPIISRYRPILISQEGEVDTHLAMKRLDWEKRTRIGKSRKVTLNLLGWLNSSNSPWELNKLVDIDLPSIGIHGAYLVVGTCFRFDENGQKTTLECEGIHSYDVDPTLEDREHNLKKLVEQELRANPKEVI